MPARNGFELQDSDIALLHYAYQLRLATIDHFAALSGRSVRALWGRLGKLKERRYLACVARMTQKQVYSIGSQGVPVLIEHGYAPTDLVNRRLRSHEATEIGIRHSLFIADIHTRILLLTRTEPTTLSQWIEGPSLWDAVPGRDGEPTIPIRPDGYFVLKHSALPAGKAMVHVFLEADRSTMAHARMAAKINGYVAYYERRLHPKKYPGMQSFVVATVTQTRSRADELRRDLQPLIPRPAREVYLFIPFEDLSLSAFLPRSAGQKSSII